jgi:hypothetical protein
MFAFLEKLVNDAKAEPSFRRRGITAALTPCSAALGLFDRFMARGGDFKSDVGRI